MASSLCLISSPIKSIHELFDIANRKTLKLKVSNEWDTETIILEGIVSQFYDEDGPIIRVEQTKLRIRNCSHEQSVLTSDLGQPEKKRLKMNSNDETLDESKLCKQIKGYLTYFNMLDFKIQQVCSPKEKLNRETLNKMQNLKEHLEKFLYHFQELFYREEFDVNIESNPQIIELMKRAERLYSIFNQLEESQIPELLRTHENASSNHYLASILGFEEELIAFLEASNDHFSKEQWILEYVEQKSQSLNKEELNQDGFKSLGFNSVKSKFLEDLAKSSPYSRHFTVGQFASRHIEYEMKNNIIICPINLGDIKDHPIDLEFELQTNGPRSAPICAVNKYYGHEFSDIINDPGRFYVKYINQQQHSVNEVTYWFHGTDHTSARQIAIKGIDVDRTRKGCDFSDGPGFYVTSNFQMAWKWPRKKNRNSQAIVIFKLKQDDIFSNTDGREFNINNEQGTEYEEWVKAIKFFRSKKEYDYLGGNLQKGDDLLEHEYMFGPIADGFDDNGTLPTKQNIPIVYKNPDGTFKKQLCVKTRKFAKKFYNSGYNIHKVIFFYEGANASLIHHRDSVG